MLTLMAKLVQILLLLGTCNAAVLPTFENPPVPGGTVIQMFQAYMKDKLGEFFGDPQSSVYWRQKTCEAQ